MFKYSFHAFTHTHIHTLCGCLLACCDEKWHPRVNERTCLHHPPYYIPLANSRRLVIIPMSERERVVSIIKEIIPSSSGGVGECSTRVQRCVQSHTPINVLKIL